MAIIELSEWLQKELDKRSWSGGRLAKLAGIDRGIVSRALNNERMPGPESLTSIARALDYPPEKVFRAAGLLPPEPAGEIDEELKYLLLQLSEQDKEEIKAIVRVKLNLLVGYDPPPVAETFKRKRSKAGTPDPALSA